MQLRWYQQEAVAAVWPHLFPWCGNNPVVVLPTGSGKSLVIAELARVAVKEWGGRVLVVQHRKELIVQNADKLYALLDVDVDVGIYSAGLKSKDTQQDVLCCGIQSVYDRAHKLGRRHLVIIDECHLCPHDGEGMYRNFLDELSNLNPKLRVVGTTATPFRSGTGPICHPKGLFRKVAYSAPVAQLMTEGYLCPITNKPTETRYATENLKSVAGEFLAREVEELFGGNSEKVKAACAEIVAKSSDRHSVIVFCAGVQHAEAVGGFLESLTGERVEVVTGTTPDLQRLGALTDFRLGHLRWLVNVDIFTTGMDAPNIDCLAILRATQSAGLFAQIIGRGMRPHESKTSCLALDFGSNFERHGPIDSADYGRCNRTGEKTGEAPVKKCPGCGESVHASATVCDCGFEFPDRDLNHGTEADTTSDVMEKPPEPETWTVKSWAAGRHKKKKAEEGAKDTLRIDYTVNPVGVEGELSTDVVSEWVCVEHDGFAQRNARKWWATHSLAPFPGSIGEALGLFNAKALAMPSEIVTLKDGRWQRVTGRTVGMLPQTWGVGDSWEGPRDEWAARPAVRESEWDRYEKQREEDAVPF
jgi:DNA repair protein RadD